MTAQMLIALAEGARKNSYAPYSHFTVGAAVLCADGSVYTGCNIENASYTPTCCAERVALFSAVADGKREFSAIAVCGGEENEKPRARCYPCGVCRQVISELCGDSFRIIFSDGSETTLGELLPNAFDMQQ